MLRVQWNGESTPYGFHWIHPNKYGRLLCFLQSYTYATRSVLSYNFLYDVAIIHQLPPHEKVETEGEDRKVFGKLAEEFSNPRP